MTRAELRELLANEPATRRANNFIDMTGREVSGMVVLHEDVTPRQWHVRCHCGTVFVASGSNLRTGHTKSCGCRQRALKEDARRRMPEYVVWVGIRSRCEDPNDISYPRYGGRGITFCDRWRDFDAFLADMGRRPSNQYSLDRINNDGPYDPANCRWATRTAQARNRRSNCYITVRGETLALAAWAERSGIGASTIRYRLRKGWEPEAAVFTPTTVDPAALAALRKEEG